MYEHNALGYRSGLALCLTKVRSSRARCPATALILSVSLKLVAFIIWQYSSLLGMDKISFYTYKYITIHFFKWLSTGLLLDFLKF